MMERRKFITKAAMVTAASLSRVRGANDHVRLGIIGCGGRGRYVGGFMKEAPNVTITDVCDVYEPNLEAGAALAGSGVRRYRDFRKLLEQKDIDAVLVATPDHWHATAAVLACEAGKDVYVEKPVSHNVKEGRAIVNAAKRSRKIVQAGTQHRSAPHFAEIANLIRSGEIGEVHMVRVWNFTNLTPDGIGTAPDGSAPAGLDWDYYCGPAPLRAFNPKRLGPTYRWFWDYAGGTITDFGVHRFDTVHQIMGVDAPKTVSATGGRFTLKDQGEMPDILQATYEYPGFVLSYEACLLNGHGAGGRTPGMRYYNMRAEDDHPHGEAYYGTKGVIIADRVGYELFPEPVEQLTLATGGATTTSAGAKLSGKKRTERRQMNTTDATSIHAKRFIEAIRGRTAPPADAFTGHRGTLIGHLGNIAYKTGEKLRWNAETEQCENSPAANALLGREIRPAWKWIQI